MKSVNRCIACGEPAPWTWFCPCCTAAKEAAYYESRLAGEVTFGQVIARREDALQRHLLEVHDMTKVMEHRKRLLHALLDGK